MPGATQRPQTSFEITRSYPDPYEKQLRAKCREANLDYPYDAQELYEEYLECQNGRESPRPASPNRRPMSPAQRPSSPDRCPSPRPGSPSHPRPQSRAVSRQPSRSQSRLLTARPKTSIGHSYQEEDRPYRAERVCRETSVTKYDPFTQNYYDRLIDGSGPIMLSLPINRIGQGRAGSTWRHVSTTTNMLGGHLAFIEGSVKETDNTYFPVTFQNKPKDIYTYVSPRLVPNQAVPTTEIRGHLAPPKPQAKKYQTGYNTRAKQGFKYWHHQQKPIDLASRFRMKALTMRNGLW